MCAVVCDFILKCLESMRRYIPFNEIIFDVAVPPHIIYNEMHSSDVPKNLISYFKINKLLSCPTCADSYLLETTRIVNPPSAL